MVCPAPRRRKSRYARVRHTAYARRHAHDYLEGGINNNGHEARRYVIHAKRHAKRAATFPSATGIRRSPINVHHSAVVVGSASRTEPWGTKRKKKKVCVQTNRKRGVVNAKKQQGKHHGKKATFTEGFGGGEGATSVRPSVRPRHHARSTSERKHVLW